MKTRYSRRVWQGFELVFRPWMRRRLDGVHIRGLEGVGAPDDRPVLLVANHVSWWDGFLLREVHRRLRPGAPFHVVMTEAELRRIVIFRWMGAVPLPASRLGARGLLADLQGRIQRRPDSVIVFFPQGRIWPSHRRPLGFRRGAAWLVGHLGRLAVVPVGLHLEHLTRPGAAAFVSVGRARAIDDGLDTGALERMVTEQVDAILKVVRTHGEAAAERWTEGGAGRP